MLVWSILIPSIVGSHYYTLFASKSLMYFLQFQAQGLNVEALKLTHLQCNRAPKQRRRTYRAHGRINRKLSLTEVLFWDWLAFFQADTFFLLFFKAFMASPCHVEIIAEEQEEPVAKGTDAPASTVAATD